MTRRNEVEPWTNQDKFDWDEVAQAYLDAKDEVYKHYGMPVRLVAFEKYSREEREAIIAGLKAAVTLAVEES